ncbi:MAG TPA: hypothetical protein VGC79_10080 [Polyangiaceae bacterium]
MLDYVRCEDEQEPRLGFERECKMRGTDAPERSAILFVAAEERCELLALADDHLDPRHDRTAE